MTMLGKFLVFVNLAISFLVFTGALILYLTRVDYTDQEATAERPAGELVARKETLKNIDPGLRRSVASARDARQELEDVEAGYAAGRTNGRPADRDLYRRELQFLETGAKGQVVHDIVVAHELKAENLPDWIKKQADDGYQVVAIRAVQIRDAKNHEMRLAFAAVAVKDAKDPYGEALLTRAELRDKEKDLVDKIAKAQGELARLTKEDIKLTNDIIGTPDNLEKGLRRRLADEKIKLAEVLKEHERVQPLLINAAVDSKIILQREELLKKRVDELMPKAPNDR
jgi:hypothetical protein